ncbi:MAG: hypothetical protein AB7O38_05420 [Pirellulaceae bacterium]
MKRYSVVARRVCHQTDRAAKTRPQGPASGLATIGSLGACCLTGVLALASIWPCPASAVAAPQRDASSRPSPPPGTEVRSPTPVPERSATSSIPGAGRTKVSATGGEYPIVVPGLVVNCHLARQVRDLPIVRSIPADQLWLQLGDLAGLPSQAAFRRDVRKVRFDQEMVVEFNDLPGARLVMRLIRAGDGVALLLTSRFMEGPTRDFELTYDRLQRAEVAARRAQAEARERLRQCETAGKATAKSLAAIQKWPQVTLHQSQRKKLALLQLQGVQRGLRHRWELARQQSSDAQARLAAVPRILAFLQAIDQRPIAFQVVLVRSSEEELLVESADP